MGANKRTARIGGLLYLIIIVSGIFSEFFVRSSLIVAGDAAATAQNILSSEMLFRIGVTSDLVMIIADVALALVFYVLLRQVSQPLSLLAAFFRLAQAAVLGINLLNLLIALDMLTGAGAAAVLGVEQMHSLAMFFLTGHAAGYRLALVFFSLNCLVVGYLLFKSGYFPKILGIGMIIAGIGYFVDSFAAFLLPNYAQYETLFTAVAILPAFVAELALTLWLLLRGVSVNQPDKDRLPEPKQIEGMAV